MLLRFRDLFHQIHFTYFIWNNWVDKGFFIRLPSLIDDIFFVLNSMSALWFDIDAQNINFCSEFGSLSYLFSLVSHWLLRIVHRYCRVMSFKSLRLIDRWLIRLPNLFLSYFFNLLCLGRNCVSYFLLDDRWKVVRGLFAVQRRFIFIIWQLFGGFLRWQILFWWLRAFLFHIL